MPISGGRMKKRRSLKGKKPEGSGVVQNRINSEYPFFGLRRTRRMWPIILWPLCACGSTGRGQKSKKYRGRSKACTVGSNGNQIRLLSQKEFRFREKRPGGET